MLQTRVLAKQSFNRMTHEVKKARTMTTMPTKNMEGENVPQAILKSRKGGDWVDINTQAYFAKGKSVVFSLPGAFTPTCSTSHLPRYEQLSAAFKNAGVDRIACVSVNDGFVMESWGKDQRIANIDLLPDGNGTFTDGMGMLCDKSAVGFGPRSWRYSMLIEDGKVKKVFSEPNKEGDPFEVSDADTMLRFLGGSVPSSTLLFTKSGCPFCAKAKALLTQKGMAYEEVVVGRDVSSSALSAVANKATVPQIFIDGKLIGGSDDLEKHLA